MGDSGSNSLDKNFDFILNQLIKGNTVERLRNKQYYWEFEQVKEWKSRYGFQFHIFPNDHLIENKPHFHLIKKSEGINCRGFFNGEIHNCEGNGRLEKKTLEALNYFLEQPNVQEQLKELWNKNNPKYII